MTNRDIVADKLAKIADGDSSIQITKDDAALLTSAIAGLSAQTPVLTKQQLLLSSYENDVAKVSRILSDAIREVPAFSGSGYDFAASQAARVTLVREVREASSLQSVVKAGLGLGLHFMGL